MRTLLFILLLFPAFLCGQDLSVDTEAVQADETAKPKKNTIVLPLLWFLPETSLGFGGVAIQNFKAYGQRPTDRSSSLQLGVAYTLNKQFLSYLPFSIYADQDRIYAKGEFGFYDYFYRYFGIGNESLDESEETYGNRFTRVSIDAYRRVVPNLYFGFNFNFDVNKIKDVESTGLLNLESPAGIDGGTFVALGPGLFWDSRNGVHAPSKGKLIELSAKWSGSGIGSDFDFSRQFFSYAQYVELKPRNVLAFQFVSETTQGEVPFNYLPDLGGGKLLRGFTNGRFRDNNAIYAQTEYRRQFKESNKFKHAEKFGMVAFIGTGKVYDEQLDIVENLHLNIGTGLRFAIDKKENLNLRLDVAFGKDSWGFYFIAGEAF